MGFDAAGYIVDGARKRKLNDDRTQLLKDREVRVAGDQRALSADYDWVPVSS